MEAINLMKYEGFESVDSSELLQISGGSMLNWVKVIGAIISFLSSLPEMYEEFSKGYQEGWNMI